MPTLNFVGGATPDVSTSWTAFGKVYSSSASTGVQLPTNARTAANGEKIVYVATAQCYYAGRGGSRQLRLGIGSSYSAWKTVASGSSATASGQLTINGLFRNGGNQVVTIDENGTSGFYFGRASGSSGSTDGNTNWGSLSGSLVYYEVPSAPTMSSVVQQGTNNAVTVTWTAPSSNGGYTTSPTYVLQWAYNSAFTGATTIATGSSSLTYTISGLTYGSTIWVRVAASNTASAAAGTTSVYSSSASAYLVEPNLSLNGWASFGTIANNTFTIQRTVIPALTPETGILRTATATATGGAYTTGGVGIAKTYTNLVIGRQYIISGRAILTASGVAGNIYRFAVVGIGNGTNVTLTSTTVGATIPSYTFTATSTTHTIRIELAESFTVTATGLQESVAFYDYALTRVATDLAYRVQDNLVNGSLVDHFDLATQSVGAHWWVDKRNVTQFAQDFDYVLPSATFSDVKAAGNVYYNDIETGYDTADIVNDITLDNVGSRPAALGSDKLDSYSVVWNQKDATSIGNWGGRRFEFPTNLYTQVSSINFVENPHLAYNFDNTGSGTSSVTFTRQVLTTMATGATGFLTSGTTQPTTGVGAYVMRAVVGASNDPTISFAYGGDGAINAPYGGFRVLPSTQYTGSLWQRAGVGRGASLTGRAMIRWYNEAGNTISDSNGTSTTTTDSAWSRKTVTATSPATAAYAVLWSQHLYTGANNAGFRYYTTAAQFETGASATTWFSGDSADTNTFIHEWEGTPGESRSIRYNNMLDTRTTELLAGFANPIVRIKSLTWNTAQNPTLAYTLDIGSLIVVTFKGTTATYRIVGMSHDITPERWMMNLRIEKV